MHLDKGHSGNFVLDNEENNNLDSDGSNDSIQTLSRDSSPGSYDLGDVESDEDEEFFQSVNARTSSSTDSTSSSESEEEDEVVKDTNTNHPPPIKTEHLVVDICFRPNSNIMAAADIAGDVYLFKYNNTEINLISTLELHFKACRDIEFNDSGTILFSAAKDLCVMLTDLETEKMIRLYEKAHEKPLYTMTVIGEHMFATGDDDGVVKMWDLRQGENKPIFSLKKMENYVSAIVTNKEGKYLVCASGDGCLTTFNIPAKKLHIQSEEYEEELTCLGLIKSETKILVGTGKGKMYVYNWGEFNLHSDEVPNLTKKAINCMIPITEKVVITGGEDGILRATSLFPHHHLGIVGEHNLSIEALDVSSDGTLIASSSHDNIIKFWDVQCFETLNASERIKDGKQRQLKHYLPSSKIDSASTFSSDLQ